MEKHPSEDYEEEPRLDPLTSACLDVVSKLPKSTPEEDDFRPPKSPLHSLESLELSPETQRWISGIFDPSNLERSGTGLFEEALISHGLLADYGDHGYLLGEQGRRLVEWTFLDGKSGAKAAVEVSGLETHHFCIR